MLLHDTDFASVTPPEYTFGIFCPDQSISKGQKVKQTNRGGANSRLS